MAKQYIGARYVPLMFEHEGSNEWVSGISYEALTIVTYLGNSFTSKKPVPSTVGSPNLNPEYWVNTGNNGSAIADLQERVSTLEDEVAPLTGNRKFWLISDSFLRYGNNWGIPFDSYTGQTSHKTYEGGAGFVRSGNQTNRTILQIVQDDDDVPSDTTDVVLYAGANDCAEQYYKIETNFMSTIAAIKSKLPNARIWVGCNASYASVQVESYSVLNQNQYIGDVYYRMMENCARNTNCCFVKSAWYCVQAKQYIVDYVHLTQDGYNMVAKAFLNKIYNGSDINPLVFNETSGLRFELCNSEYITIKAVADSILYEGTAINLVTNAYNDLTVAYAAPNVAKVDNELSFPVWCRLTDTSDQNEGAFVSVNISKDGKVQVRSNLNKSNVKKITVVGGNSITVPLIRKLHN